MLPQLWALGHRRALVVDSNEEAVVDDPMLAQVLDIGSQKLYELSSALASDCYGHFSFNKILYKMVKGQSIVNLGRHAYLGR